MRGFGGGKASTDGELPCLYIDAGGDMQIIKMPRVGKFLIDKKNRMAWGISTSLQKAYKGMLMQIITETSCCPQGASTDTAYQSPEVDRIIDETYDVVMQGMQEEQKKETFAGAIKFIALLAAVLVVVMIIAGLFQSGAWNI